VADERVQELKLENQALKKENGDLHHDNDVYHCRATEALTALDLLTSAGHSFTPFHGHLASHSFMPIRDHPTSYTPATPAFAADPSLYFVPTTDDQSVEPEGIAGPGPQTMCYHQ